MGPGLLIAVALAYAWVAWDYWQQGRMGMALAFVAYAWANIGFFFDMRNP